MIKNTFFFQLTPDIIMKAVEESGFSPTGHCMAMNSYENRVFDLKLVDDTHVIAKFYRPGRWSLEQIREEHEFLFELKGDEIPVCDPLRFPDGRTVHEIEGIYYTLWPRTGGRAADELPDSSVEILGRMLARIHNMGAVKPAEHRIQLTGTTYGLEPLAFLENNNFLPANVKSRYSAAARELAAIYDDLSREVPFHRIHGDCHRGNLLHGRDGWFFLDFDDFMTGPAVQDLWMLMPARDPEGLRQREIFLGAYRQFRDFQSSWLRLVEPLRALRYIWYAGWIARRWSDPAFPAIFPHFGTAVYWEEETSDLEGQLKIIRSEGNETDFASGTVKPKEEAEKELSNKDFFWDWEE